MANKILNIVSVSEDDQLAVASDRRVLTLDYNKNTINILKSYIELIYQHDFGKQPYFKVSVNVIYNISNYIRETFYFHETHSPFNQIEIEGDFFIELAKLFNLINDIRKHVSHNVLENIYFYVGDSIER